MGILASVNHIKKYYGTKKNIVKAIDDITFTIEYGEFIGVMGASGSGKTTLLNVISTIDQISEGSIMLDGRDITRIDYKDIAEFRRNNLGFIFQDYNLLNTLTVYENIALALTIKHEAIDTIDYKIKQISNELGITDILNKYPYEISGGQQQRTACARAIITEPKLVLADEPTGALDSKSAQMFLETITHMNSTRNATILMVTHDSFTASYCRRLLFLKDGKIFCELYSDGCSRKEFLGNILNVLEQLGGGSIVS